MQGLLIDEPPLQVLPSLAVKVGLNEALILQQCHYWLRISNNVHDGHKWIYNSYSKWQAQFPFWSERTIRRAINSLEKDGYLIVGNYNKAGFDNTKWYRIDYDKLVDRRPGQNDQTSRPDCPDGPGQNDQTNTRDYTETTTENNNAAATSGHPPEIPESNDARPAVGEALDLFQKTWRFPNEMQRQSLIEFVDAYGIQLTIAAMRLAGDRDVKRGGVVGFMNKVLGDWHDSGVKTIEQARDEVRSHYAKNYNRQQKRPAEELHDWNAEHDSDNDSSTSPQDLDALRSRLEAIKKKHREEEENGTG